MCVSPACNGNGGPDECDIAAAECEDTNEDDCCDEEESLMGGGESSQSSESESPGGENWIPACAGMTTEECWDVFYEWAFEQCWGPSCETTGSQQCQAARQKLMELGSP